MNKDQNFLKSPLRTFLYAIHEYRGRILLMYVLIVIGNATSYAVPYFVSKIVDSLVEGSTFADFTLPLSLIVAATVISEGAFRTGHWIEIGTAIGSYRRITTRLYETVLERPLAYFEDRMSGEISRRLEQIVSAIMGFIEMLPWEIGWTVVGFVTGIFLLGSASWWLVLIFAIWLVTFGTTSYFLLRMQAKATEKVSEKTADLAGNVVDALANVSLVHAFAAHGREYGYLSGHLKETLIADRHSRNILFINKIQQGWGVVILTIALISAGIYLFTLGKITVGGFVIIASVIPTITSIIWSIGEIMMRAVKSYSELKNAVEALRTDMMPIKEGSETLSDIKPSIEFKDVSFAYGPDKESVLKDFNLVIRPGERVGLVGKSGAGKSTLVKLILRAYDPSTGIIKIGDRDVSAVTVASVRAGISFVPQDTALFNRSLFDNILYAKPDATKEQVIEASKHAHAHDFIEKFPNGYDTLVGERGVKLSGGQRQRIALARAMLRNSPILVLDEATSSLDSESEEIVQTGLQTLFKDRTVLAIAHRLSTLRLMDRIIVMEHGRIAEDGSPAELLAKEEGAFKNMWERQKNGFV
ncbi:MAG TPA: ABC transporter ATP-binding protein [Candidatus Paceibacterota bacterium]